MYTIPVIDESLVGKREDYKYDVAPSYVHIRIKALREELDSLKLEADDIEIDVSSMEEGNHTAEVILKLDLDQVYEVTEISSCVILVTKNTEGPGDAAENDTSGGPSETTGATVHAQKETEETTGP